VGDVGSLFVAYATHSNQEQKIALVGGHLTKLTSYLPESSLSFRDNLTIMYDCWSERLQLPALRAHVLVLELTVPRCLHKPPKPTLQR